MNATVTYECPNCSAGLVFDAKKQKFSCEFCLSEFDKAELDATSAQERAEKTARDSEEFCGQMLEYHCPNCGAEITADESTAADYCYYCHNPVVLTGKLSGALRPSKIIPFAYDKKAAKEKFLAYAKKKLFAPSDFFSDENADKITGVYYPFWVTDADTTGRLDTVAHRVRSWSAGDKRYTETSDYRVSRAGNIHFEDIVTCALSEADKHMLEGVLPYPSDSLQDFDMPYLLGYIAKKRDIEREALTPEVRERMNSYANTLLRSTINGYSSTDHGKLQVKVHASNWDYTLMPIWLLHYKMRDKVYTFAMNGYTEKIYGEIPVSRGKLAALFGAVGGIAALISFALGVLTCI